MLELWKCQCNYNNLHKRTCSVCPWCGAQENDSPHPGKVSLNWKTEAICIYIKHTCIDFFETKEISMKNRVQTLYNEWLEAE